MTTASLSIMLAVITLVFTLLALVMAIVAAVRTRGPARVLCLIAAALTLLGPLVAFVMTTSGVFAGGAAASSAIATSIVGNLFAFAAWVCLCLAVMKAASQRETQQYPQQQPYNPR